MQTAAFPRTERPLSLDNLPEDIYTQIHSFLFFTESNQLLMTSKNQKRHAPKLTDDEKRLVRNAALAKRGTLPVDELIPCTESPLFRHEMGPDPIESLRSIYRLPVLPMILSAFESGNPRLVQDELTIRCQFAKTKILTYCKRLAVIEFAATLTLLGATAFVGNATVNTTRLNYQYIGWIIFALSCLTFIIFLYNLAHSLKNYADISNRPLEDFGRIADFTIDRRDEVSCGRMLCIFMRLQFFNTGDTILENYERAMGRPSLMVLLQEHNAGLAQHLLEDGAPAP